jgi:hypothetical protein
MAKTVEHETNLFCKLRGFKADDLGSHPCADDIVLLTKVKELKEYFHPKHRAIVNGLWGMVYVRKFPLKSKHLRQLEDITITAIGRQQKANTYMAKIRKLRKAQV